MTRWTSSLFSQLELADDDDDDALKAGSEPPGRWEVITDHWSPHVSKQRWKNWETPSCQLYCRRLWISVDDDDVDDDDDDDDDDDARLSWPLELLANSAGSGTAENPSSDHRISTRKYFHCDVDDTDVDVDDTDDDDADRDDDDADDAD